MNLGNALKTLREARGMTQEQLALDLEAADPAHWTGEAQEVETFETRTEWCIKGIEEEFAAALRIPVSLFMLFAADDAELAPIAALVAKIRQTTLDLLEGKV